MPKLKEISPLKKILIGLSLVGLGATAAVGVESIQGAKTFEDFLSNSASIAVSAFNRLQGKQVELTDRQSLARFLESGPIKSDSFSVAPQAHAKWAANRLAGDKVVRADLSSTDWQSKIKAQLITDLLEVSGYSDMNPADLAAKVSDLKGHIKGMAGPYSVIAGYSITAGANGKPTVNVATVEDSINANFMNEKISEGVSPLNAAAMIMSLDGVEVVQSNYQSKEIETMSALGEKGTLTYLDLDKLTDSMEGTKDIYTAAKYPEVLAMMLLKQKGIEIDQAAPHGRFDPSFVNAVNAFANTRLANFYPAEMVTSNELSRKIDLVGEKWDGTAHKAGLTFKFDAVMDTIKTTEAHPSVAALREAIDEPCSPGVSQVLSEDLEDPAFVKAQQCAEQYGYSLPEKWLDGRFNARGEAAKMAAPTLVGFDKGVALFAQGDPEHTPGIAYSQSYRDSNQGNQEVWQSNYEDIFVVVNPFHEDIKHLSPKMHAATMEFIAKHEIGHSLFDLARDGQVVNQTEFLRSVSEETDCDIHAVQEMVRQGHSPAFVVQVHENFLATFSGTRDFRDHKVDDEFIKDIRGKAWAGNSLMDKDELEKNLATEGGKQKLDDMLSQDRSAEMVDMINSLEFAVRHEEVKRAIESFKQGNPINVFDGFDIEQRKTFAQMAN